MKLASIRSVTRHEWLALSRALPLVAVVRLALWILPSSVIVGGTRRLATARPPHATDEGTDHRRRGRHSDRAATIVWAVTAASRMIPQATCLTQALAANLLLRREGVATGLRLGVIRSDDGEFRAHAWLEQEGRILIGGVGSRAFAQLPDLTQGGFAVSRERRG